MRLICFSVPSVKNQYKNCQLNFTHSAKTCDNEIAMKKNVSRDVNKIQMLYQCVGFDIGLHARM